MNVTCSYLFMRGTMSYKKDKKRKNKMLSNGRSLPVVDQHIRLPYKVIDHANFCLLNGNSVKVLIYLCRRCNGFFNGRLNVSQREIVTALHMSAGSAARALEELQVAQFIVCKKKGVFTVREASIWEITFLPVEMGPPSNIWGSAPRIKQQRRRQRNKANVLVEAATTLNREKIKAIQEQNIDAYLEQ